MSAWMTSDDAVHDLEPVALGLVALDAEHLEVRRAVAAATRARPDVIHRQLREHGAVALHTAEAIAFQDDVPLLAAPSVCLRTSVITPRATAISEVAAPYRRSYLLLEEHGTPAMSWST